ncbi:hypothetical protein KBB96_08875 [Luteolibacter ambystomatis]|uniref:Uncharacterized protein n=1 Tax=Luteolibacter ambystomatis TaxID=2824561 RepID=A0A975PGW4_9BACT|nr:hypothetical protein [Luteolibacter ambystomatis]QUE52990.1 hypothetical protein KBB96_08875 [Luteolibacter ambystomatis]
MSSSIWNLWVELSRVKAESLDFEVEPWESQVPAVMEAWEVLTRPCHLEALEEWHRETRNSNSRAELAADKALERCRERMGDMEGMEIVLASLPDHDKLVAEIHFHGLFAGLVSQEVEGRFDFESPGADLDEKLVTRTIPASRLSAAIAAACERLRQGGRE